MKDEKNPTPLERAENQTSLAEKVREWEETCINCHPLTPISCMTDCRIWNSKNELRRLYKIINNSDFNSELLNALKNKRRTSILELVSRGYHSIADLQQELKKNRYNHSQQTILDEYVTPLTNVGLAESRNNRFYVTAFGRRLLEMLKNYGDFEDTLPPHSECYEETVLLRLLDASKTFDDFTTVIPTKSVARVLNRLHRNGLIEATKDKDYVFYFKTKRDSNKARFSPTERRAYENITEDGVSAQKLAEKTMISLRRTYKYLRRLKGKKMVFNRKKPKTYSLTAKGVQIALILKEVIKLTEELSAVAEQFVNGKESTYLTMPDTSYATQTGKLRK